MTLTAVTKTGDLFNPSAMIYHGRDELEVVSTVQRLASAGLFCPHCLKQTGEYRQVRFRNAQVRAKHFYHLGDSDHASECANYSNEGEKHLAAVAAVGDWLDAKEKRFNSAMATDGVTVRRPDIWVQRGNVVEVHEIQISPISPEELQQRTQDLRAHGTSSVTWYLYGGVYNPANRQALRNVGAVIYHLWFEDGITFPRWKLDSGDIPKAVQRKSSVSDGCSTQKHSGAKSIEATRSVNVVTHSRKPGWEGVIHEHPWGLPDMIDIQWVKAPKDSALPIQPSRYPLRDLLLDGAAI